MELRSTASSSIKTLWDMDSSSPGCTSYIPSVSSTLEPGCSFRTSSISRTAAFLPLSPHFDVHEMPSLSTLLSTLAFALAVSAGPLVEKRASFTLQNGLDAQKLNAQFATLSADAPCTAGQSACVQGAFAQCVNGKFVTSPCSGGLTCLALPLVNSPGTRLASTLLC